MGAVCEALASALEGKLELELLDLCTNSIGDSGLQVLRRISLC